MAEINQSAITCSKLTIETQEQGVKLFEVNNKDTRTTHFHGKFFFFIVNFKHISHLVLVFLVLTLNMLLPARLDSTRFHQPVIPEKKIIISNIITPSKSPYLEQVWQNDKYYCIIMQSILDNLKRYIDVNGAIQWRIQNLNGAFLRKQLTAFSH